MMSSENVRLDSTEQDEQKPAESQAHMHIAKPYVCFKYFPVKKTFHENLLYTLTESFPEKASLQPELVLFRKIVEPDHTAHNGVDNDKIQPEIEWYDEDIMHIFRFQMPCSSGQLHFLC